MLKRVDLEKSFRLEKIPVDREILNSVWEISERKFNLINIYL